MWSEFFQPRDLAAILPQLQLTVFACGILLMDFLLEQRHKYMNAVTALLGIVFSGFAVYRLRETREAAFGGLVMVDSFFVFFSLIFLLAAAVVILMSMRYLELEGEHEGEYYSLVLFATVGMMFLAGGQDLITLFIGLELMAVCFYLLTGFLRRDRRSTEAAIKYFLLGAFSTGILAYGFSLFYGISGSTNLERIAIAVRQRGLEDPVVFLAMVAVAAGLFFKIAAVPFHQWAPDVYEGAPTPITAFISVGSKAASFALVVRLFLTSMGPLREHWVVLLSVVAVATMTIGNLAAIGQTNVKRLLAYSSIGHVGYILLGLVAGNETGRLGISIYIFAYAAMTLGAFAVVTGMRRSDTVGDTLDDMRGLIFKNPTAAVLMLIFLLSLTGIPPLVGFYGKWFIFLSLIQTQHYTLAIFAALYVVVALYYYFRIVVMMFLQDAREPGKMSLSPGLVATLAITVLLTVLPGLYPEPLIELAQFSIRPFR
ncbi:MAG: NADH-quinone oxidoreductase subunit N [Candidatus Acidiferrales bacterium]